MTSQIDRLDPEQRTVVRMAAVLGQSFLAEELAALSRRAAPDRLRGVLEEFDSILTFTGPGALRFRHALVRDAAYEELPYRRRRALHARAGDALAQAQRRPTRGRGRAPLAPLLPRQPLRRRVAVRARRGHPRARQVRERRGRGAPRPRDQRGAARRRRASRRTSPRSGSALGDVTERAGIYDRALQAYRTARRLHGDDAGRGGRACSSRRRGSPSARAATPRRCARCARASSSSATTTRSTRSGPGRACTPGTRRSARRRAAHGRRCASASPRSRARSRSATPRPRPRPGSSSTGPTCRSGSPSSAVHSERALELYTELGDLTGQAVVLNNLGGFAYFDGRWDEAVELYEQARGAPRAHRQRGRRAPSGCTTSARCSSTRVTSRRRTTAIAEADRVWRASDYRGRRRHRPDAAGPARGGARRVRRRAGATRRPPAGSWWRSTPTPTSWRSTSAPPSACSPPATTAPRAGPSTRRSGATRRSVASSTTRRCCGCSPACCVASGDLELAETTIRASLDEARERDASFEIARALDVLAEHRAAHRPRRRRGDPRRRGAAALPRPRRGGSGGDRRRASGGRTSGRPRAAGSRTRRRRSPRLVRSWTHGCGSARWMLVSPAVRRP